MISQVATSLRYPVIVLLCLVLSLHAADKKPDLTKLPPAATGAIDFARDIQPILQTRCLECHGAAKHKAGLRLDDGKAALRGGDSGAVIVPGKSAASRLIHVVAGADAETKMPPKGPPLTAAEVGKLRAWIDQGANWPKDTLLSAPSKHWSFQPIQRPTPPKVTNSRWVRNPIDSFVLARLEAEKIAPAPEADRATLIRRLSLDLTGLPPTLGEVDDFLNDARPAAYERVVDRLLDSPHYGEQWARHWLDLARYADSDGYEKDLLRPHAWRWRDWVIDAFNRDVPFDRFTLEQIAGDLLPADDRARAIEQHVATGFQRNTLLNREGGIDIEEDRNKIVVDRINTVATVWLGLTLGCAECHSHKYDPITQREYYQLFAFFNSTDDRDMIAPLPGAIAELEKKRAGFLETQRRYVEVKDADFEAWTKKVAELPNIWHPPDSYELPTFNANNGANLYPQEDGSFLVTGTVGGNTHYVMMSNTRLRDISGIRVEALTDDMLPQGGPGWSPRGNFVLSELRVEASPLADVTKLKKVAVDRAVADHAQKSFEIERAIDGDDKTGWAIDMPGLALHGVDRCAVFLPQEKISHEDGTRLKISLVQHGGPNLSLGRFRVMMTNADRAVAVQQAVPQRIRDLAAMSAGKRSLDQQVTLLRYYHATLKPEEARFKDFTQELAEWRQAQGDVRAQVLVERKAPRKTHVHIRGDFLNKGEAVAAAFPALMHEYRRAEATSAPLTRLDLARWLVDPANPLTARVTVNRFWHHLFGEGLVRTLADFGSQGDRPSHPELLDWLASEFRDPAVPLTPAPSPSALPQGERGKLGWSQKRLIRTIVTSATYRQASRQRAELAERDPRNRLLARQNRFRLPAEAVRDQFLEAGGLLNDDIGGASLPVQRKCRGLYVQFKRAFPENMLATFDAPSATVTCPMRERSNTPLQALTLLNGPLFVECAQGLARRTLKEAKPETAERLRHAFRLTLARLPADDELKALTDLFKAVEKIYAEDDESAAKVAGKDMPLDVARSESAALVIVARAILNLDEVIVRE